MHKEYAQTADRVLSDLQSGPEGLSAAQAEGRLAEYGPNRLREAPKATLLQRFIQQLKDPMLLILMAAAAVSAVTNYLSHEPFTEVLIILAVVLLNAVLGVIQESKAEAAIEALQTMTAATSKVLRDGAVAELESSRLVPGDVVLLEAGDAVPADGRLLACASLQIEEALAQLRTYYEKTCPRLVPEIATELIVLDKDAQPAYQPDRLSGPLLHKG